MQTSIVWFRKDLRTHDNMTLLDATKSDEVIPVYVFDPSNFDDTMHDGNRINGFRAKFLTKTVNDLQETLQEMGSDLYIRVGNTADVLSNLAEKTDADKIHFQTLPGIEELDTESEVKQELDLEINRYWTHTLYHINDLPEKVQNIDDTFTPWRKSVQYSTDVRDTVDVSVVPSIDTELDNEEIPDEEFFGVEFDKPPEKSSISYSGGESNAIQRIEEYMWKQDNLREYKKTRNGLLGEDYSSKISPWLANGSLSPRYVYEEVNKYEEERTSNDSTYWLVFELMWRDFFQFQFIKHGSDFFTENGIRDVEYSWSRDSKAFERWCNGTTGIPFVDANMRELNRTGYMSNRGRQNVASFLTDVLDIDWRMGAAYFEERLVDYDVCSNWGNWAYIAGVGNDSRDDRYFNVLKQADKYDPNAEFIRHWIPELDSLPADATKQPWNLTESQQAMYDVHLGIDYPRPIVDLSNNSYREIVNMDVLS